MHHPPDFDTLLDICRHKYRRIVLATLANQQQALSIDDLTNAIIKYNHHTPSAEVDDETFKRIHVGLCHAHLPKLADAGFIQYDPEQKMVELKIQIGREESNLSAILAMDPDLPPISRSV